MDNKSKLLIAFLFFTRIFQLDLFSVKMSVLTLSLFFFFVIKFKNRDEFSSLIKLFIGCIFISCISSWIYRGQDNIFTTFTQAYFYLGLLFYYVCAKIDISKEDLEKGLITIGLISVVCYLIQFSVYPTVIFSDAQNDYDTEIRVRMCGSIIYSYLFFFGINKYVLRKNIKYLLYTVFGFICIIIMGFRSLTVSLLVLGLLEYLYLTGLSSKRLKQLVPLLIIVGIVSQLNIVNEKFLEMLARQERGDSFDNENYVRFAEFDYYWNHYFTDNIERFFGSGLPAMGTSFYKQQMYNFSYNLYWNDWGILGLSWMFGIPSALLLYFMYFKVIFSKLPKEYIYLKAIFLYLVLTSLTSAEAFRPGNLLLQGSFLYLVMKIKKSQEYD